MLKRATPVTITIEPISENLYQISCPDGEEFGLPPYRTNLVASVGEDGILLVDEQRPAQQPGGRAGGPRHVATHAEHHAGTQAPQQFQRLPQRTIIFGFPYRRVDFGKNPVDAFRIQG